jgi:hypothetical protein
MRRRPTVDPAFTFGIALVVSLVLWWGTLRALLAGNVDITVAGLRYLAALGLAWVSVYLIASLVAGYGHDPRPAPRPPAEHPLRRHDDPVPEEPAA